VPAESSASPVTNVALDIRRFPWVRPLSVAYAHEFESLAGFFAGDPARPEAWREAVARRHATTRPHQEIAGIVEAQQLRRGAPCAALAAAERLRDPRAVAVVTGQQAGLFGGPAFGLLKALTAVVLAERITSELKVPAVAVFWVEAEDHDWEEVRSASVLDARFELRTIRLDSLEGAGRLPVGRLTLDAEITRAIDELAAALPPTEFTAELLEAIRAAYAPGHTMSDAFARLSEWMLGDRGLIVFDASDPAAKPLVADLFARELEAPGHALALATAAGTELRSRGHEPQITPVDDGTALFSLDGARLPIRRRGDQLTIGDHVHDKRTLAEEARRHPERFSPNVLLRPIVQDTLFPTVCYVAGPSELAYWAQFHGVYQHFGLPMPLVQPRLAATILDSASARFLAHNDLPFEDLQQHDESALNRLLDAALPPSVEASLEQAVTGVRERMTAVIEAVPAIDPTLAGAATTTLGRMEHDLRTLHTKIIHAAKRRDETLRRQFIRAQSQAFPDGHLQERTVASIFFINRYGPAIHQRVLSSLPFDPGVHWIVTA